MVREEEQWQSHRGKKTSKNDEECCLENIQEGKLEEL